MSTSTCTSITWSPSGHRWPAGDKPAVGFRFRLPRRIYDVTARRHAQHPAGEPVNAGKSSPVAAKAAAIDAAQARPLTWKTVVKRALAVAVAGAAIYLVLPKLMAVLGAWPRLSTLNPVWFTPALVPGPAPFPR